MNSDELAKLNSMSKEELDKLKCTEKHKVVERWTKNVDLFSKDIILIPINESLHWTLLIIVNPNRLHLLAEEEMVEEIDETEIVEQVEEGKKEDGDRDTSHDKKGVTSESNTQ